MALGLDLDDLGAAAFVAAVPTDTWTWMVTSSAIQHPLAKASAKRPPRDVAV